MVVGLDAVLCLLASFIAFYLRLGIWVLPSGKQWLAVLIAVTLALPVFWLAGLYRTIVRHLGNAALLSIAKASICYGAGYFVIITFAKMDNVPRTTGVIQPVLLFLLVASSRVIVSWWLSAPRKQLVGLGGGRTMIYGAGSAGRQLFQALAASETRVRGFIDDDAALHGRVLLGRTIFAPSNIKDLVCQGMLSELLLAIPSVSRKRRAEIIARIGPLGVTVRTIPGLTDLAQGRVRIEDLHPLDLDDLLGREPVAPDQDLLARNNRGKTVLVTGAGGSIGSELCRQILAVGPAALLLVELSEPALYTIQQELQNQAALQSSPPRIVALLASVCDADRVDQILRVWHPDTIYHAAAYKHVPLVEHNPAIGVRNNVFGTLTMVETACRRGVADFVFVSTDKAVRPTNVMGTTKRLAEQVLQALAANGPSTRLSLVRFGNVLGSSGSVVPLFRQQIEAGGPITLTHPEISRYFMTIPEAAQLVIQAGAMATGGEVFVLDMGSPIKILALARMMVELSGSALRTDDNPDGDIEITYVGLRPGEKLYEELLIGDNPLPTFHPRIMKANESFIPWPRLSVELERLRTVIDAGEVEPLLALLVRLVPEYTPAASSVDWNHRERLRALAQDPSITGSIHDSSE